MCKQRTDFFWIMNLPHPFIYIAQHICNVGSEQVCSPCMFKWPQRCNMCNCLRNAKEYYIYKPRQAAFYFFFPPGKMWQKAHQRQRSLTFFQNTMPTVSRTLSALGSPEGLWSRCLIKPIGARSSRPIFIVDLDSSVSTLHVYDI